MSATHAGDSVRVEVVNTAPTGLGYRSRIVRTIVDGVEVSRVEVVGMAPGILPKLTTATNTKPRTSGG